MNNCVTELNRLKKKLSKTAELFVARLGSNLDSSEPKSDVLPVTPSGIGCAKVIILIYIQNKLLEIISSKFYLVKYLKL